MRLPVWHPVLVRRHAAGRLAVLDGIREFREHLGGELCITLPDGLGRKVEVHEILVHLVDLYLPAEAER